MKLSKRMLMNVNMIPTGKTVADVGCDHGFVSIYLIEQGLAKRVLAMDVAKGPLSMARDNIEAAGLGDCIELRLSNGVDKLEYSADGSLEAEVILIAGMGGRLAVSLISDNIEKCRSCEAIVLQAQSELDYVRQRVYELGFVIDDEEIVFDEGKYYVAMRIVPVKDAVAKVLSCEELRYGPILLSKKGETLYDYLIYKRESYRAIQEKINDNSSMSGRADEIEKELLILDKILQTHYGE